MRFGSAISWVASSIPITAIKDFASTVRGFRLSDFAAPGSAVSMGNQRLTGLAAPTDANDAARKAYVDSAVSSAQSAAEAAAKNYADGRHTAALAADTATLNAAKEYADTKPGSSRESLGLGTASVVAFAGVDATAPGIGSARVYSGSASASGYLDLLTAAGSRIALVGNSDGTRVELRALASGSYFDFVQSPGALPPRVSGQEIIHEGNFRSKLPSDLARIKRGFFVGDGSRTTFNCKHDLGVYRTVVAITNDSGELILTDHYPVDENNVSIMFAEAPFTGLNFYWTLIG